MESHPRLFEVPSNDPLTPELRSYWEDQLEVAQRAVETAEKMLGITVVRDVDEEM